MGIIRLLLAISVVLEHSSSIFGFQIVGGRLAVEIFYIISGFYMALILNEKYVGKNTYKLFITNRMLKLYPIYWTVLALIVILSVLAILTSGGENFLFFKAYKQHFNEMSVFTFLFLIFTNIVLFFQDIVMFLGLDVSNGSMFFTSNFNLTDPQLFRFLMIPQAWTISLELMFYLLAPFIARRSLKLILPLIVLSAGIKFLLYSNGLDHDPWTYRFFPAELHLFLSGIVAYKIYIFIKDKHLYNKYLYTIFFLNVALILSCSFIREYFNISENLFDYLFMILFFASLPFIFKLCKSWRFDSKIGELSYPVYISHLFVVFFINYLITNVVSLKEYNGLIVTVLTILFSLCLNYFVYNRIEKYRQARVKRAQSVA